MGLKISVNGKDVKLNLENFTYKDEKGISSDSITLQVAGEFAKPKYQDEIKAQIDNFPLGTFLVQNVKFSKFSTTIEATAVNFSGGLKEKKQKTFKKTTIEAICKSIAHEHALKCKCDVDIEISHISQINQSDLQFLRKLSTAYNATFTIKNNTLLFLKDKKEDKVTYKINENECESWELEYTNKTFFNSARAVWQDTKTNKVQSIVAGSGEPTKILQEHFKDKYEAQQKAKSALELLNKGTIKGSLSTHGRAIEAGAKLIFKEKEFQIVSVNHTLSNSWSIDVEFQN